ncbi:MAG: hypothetical protein M3R38_04570 [Actinomycetota bacterium]|nr:hypothetical protein [Actinomycetota bacterium]
MRREMCDEQRFDDLLVEIMPTLETADHVAKALGVTLSSMFSELEKEPHCPGGGDED